MAETPTPDAWRADAPAARRRGRRGLRGLWTAGDRGTARLPAGLPPRRSRRARRAPADAHARRCRPSAATSRSQGPLLAYSVDADTIYAVPTRDRRTHGSARRAALCDALEDCTPKISAALTDRLSDERGVRVRASATSRPSEARRVAALEARRHRLHEGEPPLLSEPRPGRARARLRRPRQHRPRRASRAAYDKVDPRQATASSSSQTDARRHAFGRLERAADGRRRRSSSRSTSACSTSSSAS